jgi:phosphatidylcholine synthase
MAFDSEISGPDHPGPNLGQWASAFAVHVLTASGAGLSLLALLAAMQARWASMFFWLGMALLVDAFDGTLARRFKISERLPRWSGETLDLVVDYLNYVFVPAYAIIVSGVLPRPMAVPGGIAILITSALYFADRLMKTTDNYFRGFPALWNLVAFYLLLLRPEPRMALGIIIVLCAVTFLPLPFLHPIRVARFRPLNLAVLAAWCALALLSVLDDMAPAVWVKIGLSAIAVWFVASGLLRRPIG